MVDARETVKLQCADDEIYDCDKEDAMQSSLIKGLIDDGSADDPDTPLPVTQVSAATMRKCMVFVEHMRTTSTEPEIESPLPSNDLS